MNEAVEACDKKRKELTDQFCSKINVEQYLNHVLNVSHEVYVVCGDNGVEERYIFEPKYPYFKDYNLSSMSAAVAAAKMIISVDPKNISSLFGVLGTLDVLEELSKPVGSIPDFEFNFCMLMATSKILKAEIDVIGSYKGEI